MLMGQSVTVNWVLAAWVSAGMVSGWCPPARGDAESAVRAEAIARHVGEIVRRVDRDRAAVSIVVADLADGRSLGAGYATTPLIPASIQKQLVMAAAIDQLGPGFSFRTVVGTYGRDVVVVGDGDPGLGDPRLCQAAGEEPTAVLNRWADALKRSGVSVVEGDLVVDESIFDGQWVHPSWEPNDLPKWYAAPVGGLNLADNCIEVTAFPSGGRVGWE
ncbi:MAG: hypothetical protein HOP29_17190, partial [Phycisphaerales bacterium]|nr:hypothetical protein [Phycisphaerales bacterium]